MNAVRTRGTSIPDAMIAWTTASALVAFGIIYFDDSVIMGRTIFGLGVLSAANEVLKLSAARGGSDSGHARVRLALAVAYAVTVIGGFLWYL